MSAPCQLCSDATCWKFYLIHNFKYLADTNTQHKYNVGLWGITESWYPTCIINIPILFPITINIFKSNITDFQYYKPMADTETNYDTHSLDLICVIHCSWNQRNFADMARRYFYSLNFNAFGTVKHKGEMICHVRGDGYLRENIYQTIYREKGFETIEERETTKDLALETRLISNICID